MIEIFKDSGLSCVDCKHKQYAEKDSHCYMFLKEPKPVGEYGFCAQHNKLPKIKGPLAHLMILASVWGSEI